jgi:ankyrin repeat protein
MFSLFNKPTKTHPAEKPAGAHASDSATPEYTAQLIEIKQSYEKLLATGSQGPSQALLFHIITCMHVLGTMPDTRLRQQDSRAIQSVISLSNSTFVDVIEILLAEVFCIQPGNALCDREVKFCHDTGSLISMYYPSFLKRKLNEKTGKTLLHIVCQIPVNGLETVKAVYEIAPEQIRSADASGALPLHFAAHSAHPARADVIKFLLQLYPEAVRHADNEGYLPLHWAVNSSVCSIEVVQCMLDAFPEAVNKQCKGGTLPLHWTVDRDDADLSIVKLISDRNTNAIRHVSEGNWLPLHRCVDREQINMTVLKFLIDQNPDGLMLANDDGHLPVHRLVDHENINIPALELLIKCNPLSLTVPDQEGYLPLHILLEAMPDNVPIQPLSLVLDAYPDAACQTTLDGLCALHCAMSFRNHLNFDIIQALIECYPSAVLEDAIDTGSFE